MNPLTTVAKVSQALANANDWTFTDSQGNYCVSMCIAAHLTTSEFVAIPVNTSTNYGTMPTNPKTPIFRP